MKMRDFVPSYTCRVENREEFTREFGLEWNGPGIYVKGNDTLVVAPEGECESRYTSAYSWAQSRPGPYVVFVWNDVDPFVPLAEIVRAPTRFDDRR